MKALVYCWLSLASVASAAIDGTVTNKTTGKPQPRATVTLYKLGATGLEFVASVKSDAAGKFHIEQNLQGTRLLMSAYGGVTYNHTLRPNEPTTDVALDVLNSSKKPGGAKVVEHMVLFAPNATELAISERYIWRNTGKTTFSDADGGTLQFHAPPGSKGIQVNCTAPQGQPIRRAPQPAGEPDVYKIDFPIKPGRSEIEVNYTVPFTSPGTFEGKVFYKGNPTSLIAPQGVQLKGKGLVFRGQEPQFGMSIYQTTAAAYKVEIVLQRPQAAETEQSEPQIQFILPKLYNKLEWVLALSLSILALGFVLLYRSEQPVASPRKVGKRK